MFDSETWVLLSRIRLTYVPTWLKPGLTEKLADRWEYIGMCGAFQSRQMVLLKLLLESSPRSAIRSFSFIPVIADPCKPS